MIRKYLCENIVRLLEAYIELTECNFVFIWSSDPVLLQHIFCLTESDSFLRQVETWHKCVVKSGNFTKNCLTKKVVTHRTASRNLARESGDIFSSNVPLLCIFCVLCSTYFLSNIKVYFMKENLSSPYFRFSIICYFNVKAVPHNERHIFKIDISNGKSAMCA